MTQSNPINVYDLVPVPNVCDQVLREIISLPKFSLAHVLMNKWNVSLWHQHSKMSEIYYILSGEGTVYRGEEATYVEKGAFIVLPSNTPHKLENTGNSDLEHLVFAIPPFNPTDVQVLNDSSRKTGKYNKFEWDKKPLTALDGAKIYELMTESQKESLDVALAVGFLPVRRKAIPHHHLFSEEIYYILDGVGKVKVGEQSFDVKKDSLIHIYANQIHSLENLSTTKELSVLCASSPAYRDGDFIVARK